MTEEQHIDSAPPSRRFIFAAIGCVVIALSVRSTVEHVRAYERAVELERADELEAAISEYRWALRWYTPWGPWHVDAAQALWDIGERHELENPMRAVRAYDALRSGLIASRSIFQPQDDLLQRANQKLPPLLVRVAERRNDKRDKAALLKRFTADYERRVGVALWASAAVALGFLLWVGGLLLAFLRGVDEQGRLVARGWRMLLISAGGFACWATAMYLG